MGTRRQRRGSLCTTSSGLQLHDNVIVLAALVLARDSFSFFTWRGNFVLVTAIVSVRLSSLCSISCFAHAALIFQQICIVFRLKHTLLYPPRRRRGRYHTYTSPMLLSSFFVFQACRGHMLLLHFRVPLFQIIH